MGVHDIFSNINVFSYNGKKLAIDAATLAVFELDNMAADYILGDTLSEEDLKNINYEMQFYLNKGYFKDIGIPDSMEAYLSSYNISVQNTLNCPLNCTYCFSKKIKSDPRVMDSKVAGDVVKFIFDKFDGLAETYEVYFTSGGEPLGNFDVIKQIYEFGKEYSKIKKKGFKVGFTTNTLLLDDEKLEYLENSEMGFMISIDGNESQHNKNRKKNDGTGSYENILDVIKKLKGSANSYLNRTQALVVLTGESKSYVDILKYLVDIGFNKVNMKVARNVYGEEPVISVTDIPMIKDRYKELIDFITQEVLNNKWKYVIPIIDQNNILGQIMINMILRKKIIYRCDAGKSKISILPNGDIYPCDFFSIIPEAKMGNIYDGIDRNKRKEWFNSTYLSYEECKTCWARFLCAGGCYYSRYLNGKKPDFVECSLSKFIGEQVAGMIYTIYNYDKKLYKYLKSATKNIKERIYDV